MRNSEALFPVPETKYFGMVLSDVDQTLYDTTEAVKKAMQEGKLKHSIFLYKALLYWSMKGFKGRDWFSKKIHEIYAPLLKENGPQRMEDFYRFLANTPEVHHHGAVDLIQTAVKSQILMVFISGNDRKFVEIFLEENGLNPKQAAIYAAEFTIDAGRYTKEFEGTETGTQRKKEIVKKLRNDYPGVPILGAIGDDEADVPLLHAASEDHGFCVVVGENSKFHTTLTQDEFSIFHSVHEYLNAPHNKKALRVSARPQKGKNTLADVEKNFHRMLEGNIKRPRPKPRLVINQ